MPYIQEGIWDLIVRYDIRDNQRQDKNSIDRDNVQAAQAFSRRQFPDRTVVENKTADCQQRNNHMHIDHVIPTDHRMIAEKREIANQHDQEYHHFRNSRGKTPVIQLTESLFAADLHFIKIQYNQGSAGEGSQDGGAHGHLPETRQESALIPDLVYGRCNPQESNGRSEC